MINGQCQCGEVNISLLLSNSISVYSARACDCDFCLSRHIAYLSEPGAHLTIQCKNELHQYQQGSNQASFLACPNCEDIIAVTYQLSNSLKGAVNATRLDDFRKMKKMQRVSPKLLSAKEKSSRWRELWMDVAIT